MHIYLGIIPQNIVEVKKNHRFVTLRHKAEPEQRIEQVW